MTLGIQRVLPDSTICKIKLCKLIQVLECTQCETFISSNNVAVAVDMSLWTPSIGIVSFYPTLIFNPYNIRIEWDFDCDGNIDQTTTGNSLATYNCPCGPKTICYKVRCMKSQQVDCYSKSYKKTFNIPCTIIDTNCCADFMTDVMNYGIVGTGVIGNTYNFCLSPNISSTDIVQWDLNADGIIDATTNPCATFTLIPSNFQICATVLHINGNGDTCKVKVNSCLPEVIPIGPCSCDTAIFNKDVRDGFTWIKTSPYDITFTPKSLLNNCDVVTWVFGDGTNANTIGNASISHTYPSTPKTYTVCMFVTRTDPNGIICKAEFCDTIKLNGMVAINDIETQKLSIKPNPTSDFVHITLSDNLNKNGNQLRLTSIEGKVTKSLLIKSKEININLEFLPPGLYFLQVISNNKVITVEKLIKQ